MGVDLPLKCACGAVRGTLKDADPQTGQRLVCACDDCQSFAHFLNAGDTVLDGIGGTDIFQVAPAQLQISHGLDQIRCVRLSANGMFRFYAGCCATPVANTMRLGMPFAGIPSAFVDHEADGRTREATLGPLLATVNGRFATGPVSEDVYHRVGPGLLASTMVFLARNWWHGLARPNVLFTDAGDPIGPVTVIDKTERAALLERCGPIS